MTMPFDPDLEPSRKVALKKGRLSRRPSRLGEQAGVAARPDVTMPDDAGFPGLLKRTWQAAVAAPDRDKAVDILLTLDGHVPAEVQLRSLPGPQEYALAVLTGRTWRDRPPHLAPLPPDGDEPAAFLGEIGLSHTGRVVVRLPSTGPLDSARDLVDGVLRVSWSQADLTTYQQELARAETRMRASVSDCRDWLEDLGAPVRLQMLDQLKEAAFRTAPFILYAEERLYTNFREQNTLTGKTLWPGHPNCALSSLVAVPVALWSDSDVLMVVGLTLLVRSAGFGRIEEANGTQLSIDHVAYLLERTRRAYNAVEGVTPVAAPGSPGVRALNELALALAVQRPQVMGRAQLYREIHGPLLHKVERVAGPAGGAVRGLEAGLCARISGRLPLRGSTFEDLEAGLGPDAGWLAEPAPGFATGLESLVHETVSACTAVFDADFAMSRGMRSLGALVAAIRAEDWARIAGWDTPHFFCCVVPGRRAAEHFGDSASRVADIAWSMAARMQYNSWHFLAGNMPRVPQIQARDFFVPPAIPDIAYYSDQHHNGHVMAKVRFSVRSPQSVRVLGRPLNGFIDLRLLRCAGTPFGEADLLAAHRASRFLAAATGRALELVAEGRDLRVTAFDPQWHRDTIAG